MDYLDHCTLITVDEYCALDNPKFEGQTRADANGVYYVVCSCNGVFYKIRNTL